MTAYSFEFFPPKSEKAEANLWQVVDRLSGLNPDFVSITYGAGGSTRERTHACVKKLSQETELTPAAHLTCVSASKAEVDAVIDSYKEVGVNHIVALRGDMPDMGAFVPHPDGYQSSTELVAAIAQRGGFEISVSAYPEKHPESASLDADIDMLKAKIDAGATRAITQFVFDTEHHLRFRDKLAAAGVDIELRPGIMPTTNFNGVCRMAEKCNTHVPQYLHDIYKGLDEEELIRQEIACFVAAQQCQLLTQEGFEHIHFYTLNQADLTLAVTRILECVNS